MKTEKQDIYVDPNGIFAYCNPLSFTWMGGRLLIMDDQQRMVDFGDGGMSIGRFGHPVHEFKHNVLGHMKANNTFFEFYDYGIEFDWKLLKNCNLPENKRWMNQRVAKIENYESRAVYHLKRFAKKRKIQNT